jgi:hypothetical protein
VKYFLSKKRPQIVALAILAVTTVVFVWRTSGPDPDARARQFARYLEREDWGAIYDMASTYEKQRQPWDRAQFVALMRELSTTCFSRIGPVSVRGTWGHQSTTKMFFVDFNSSHPGGAPIPVKFVETFRRDAEDWHPTIYYLPIYLHSLRERPTKKSLSLLVAAADKAGIGSLVRFDDNLELSMDKLRLYLDKKLTWSEVYQHRPDTVSLDTLGAQ